MSEIVQLLILCGTILAVACLVLLALPNSKLRSCFAELAKYLLAATMALLVVSPIDILPDVIFPIGFADDLAYIVTAISAFQSARKDRIERQYLP